MNCLNSLTALLSLAFLLTACQPDRPLPPVLDPPPPCYEFDYELGMQPGAHPDARCTDGNIDGYTQQLAIKKEAWFFNQAQEVTTKELAQSGARAYEKIKKRYVPLRKGVEQMKVEEVLRRMLPHTVRTDIDYQITVIRSRKRPVYNAMVTADGQIFITKSLYDFALRIRESTLAAIIAHEIGHVENLHGDYRIAQEQWRSSTFGSFMDGLSEVVIAGVSRCIDRHNEVVADKSGMYLMHQAGYDSEGMIELFRGLQDLRNSPHEASLADQLFNSHPLDQTRFDCATNYFYDSRSRVPNCRSQGKPDSTAIAIDLSAH